MAKKPTKNRGTFKPGSDPRQGRGPAKGAPNAGRPKEEARTALLDLIHQRGLREKALKTLQDALNNKDAHGNVTPAAIKAAELILERSDPAESKMTVGGEITVNVRRIPWGSKSR